MARKHVERPVDRDAALPFTLRRAESPTGPERIAWSYLAAVLSVVVVGLGVAVADALEPAVCDSEDVACLLGVYITGALVSGLLGTALTAWLLRLGWEWWLLVAAAIVTMPAALDLIGPSAWTLLVVAPALAALATLGGPVRPRWRPWVIAGASVAWIVWMSLIVFVL